MGTFGVRGKTNNTRITQITTVPQSLNFPLYDLKAGWRLGIAKSRPTSNTRFPDVPDAYI